MLYVGVTHGHILCQLGSWYENIADKPYMASKAMECYRESTFFSPRFTYDYGIISQHYGYYGGMHLVWGKGDADIAVPPLLRGVCYNSNYNNENITKANINNSIIGINNDMINSADSVITAETNRMDNNIHTNNDDIVNRLLFFLISYSPFHGKKRDYDPDNSLLEIAHVQSKKELINKYINILLFNKSPWGYFWQTNMIWNKYVIEHGVRYDTIDNAHRTIEEEKEVLDICNKADQEGLALSFLYSGYLAKAYLYALLFIFIIYYNCIYLLVYYVLCQLHMFIPIILLIVSLCLSRSLIFSLSHLPSLSFDIYKYIYSHGLGGVDKDGNKVIEYCNKALEIASNYQDQYMACKGRLYTIIIITIYTSLFTALVCLYSTFVWL